MPTGPVLLDVPRKIGPIEVLRHDHAEELAHAQNDVDAAGEVGVEPEGVEDHAQQDPAPSVVGGLGPEQQGQGGSQPIRQDHLLPVAPQHPHQAPAQPVRIEGSPLVEGLREHVVAADGPLDHLGEEGGEEGVLQQVRFRRVLAPLHVDEVADGLEGVEGDAQGQHPIHPPGGMKGLQQEGRVFQGPQKAQVEQ